MAKLYFKYGVMGSSKTAQALITKFNYEENKKIADYLIKHGVTVQECKVAEIDQFKLPIDDAILILKEEHKQRADGYATHLSYGGKGDPAEEVHLDALEMAIAALELQKQTPLPPKGE